MAKKDNIAITLGSFMLLYASGLPLTSVFVIVPYFLLLLTYFRVFRPAYHKEILSGQGKAVFITGCDTGFGNGLAARLAESGFTVFAGCLKPDQNGAKDLLLHAPRGNLQIVECDVTDDEIMQKCVDEVKKSLGDKQLWAVVNNAGIAQNCFAEWCSLDLYKLHHEINVLGLVRTTKLFLPLLRQTPNSRVINVASIAGRISVPGFSAYCMSKFAVRAFSDTLRAEISRFGVRVITIEPGLYKTPISGIEAQLKGNKTQWDQAPAEVRESYGEHFFGAFLKSVRKTTEKARSNTDEVVDVMINAVRSAEPDRDYCPHWTTRLRICIMHLLPASMESWLLTKTNPVARIETFM